MKILIFNGSFEKRSTGTAQKILEYFTAQFENSDTDVTVFDLATAGIPFFDITLPEVPHAAKVMAETFRASDIHIWLTPLYHGGMTGAMKNCIDWLEITSRYSSPYLSGKVIGLVCWANGPHALQGINAMDAVAKSLRAWTLPFTIPIIRKDFYGLEGNITEVYKNKFDKMVKLLTTNNLMLI